MDTRLQDKTPAGRKYPHPHPLGSSTLCVGSCKDLPAVIVSLELQSLLKMLPKHSEDALDTHSIFWEKIATRVIELGS